MNTDLDLRTRYINVADERLGAVALCATDEFFAPKERMLRSTEPIWREGIYDEHGKWMDGWETRRRRDQAHDYCIIQLAAPATLAAVDIDTRHFTGNYPPLASVQACCADRAPDGNTNWSVLLPPTALSGNQHNLFALSSPDVWTHLKLNIFPDGGVARFRAYGRIVFDWAAPAADSAPLDLAAALHGGRVLACSDEHYGSMHNVLLPGRAASMADGWETRRRRAPGFDWLIVQLGHSGRVHHIDIDTAHFKGNFPHQVSIQGVLLHGACDAHAVIQSMYWNCLLEPHLLSADCEHRFDSALHELGPISHLRVNIHPDGGVSRIRVFGHPDGP